MTKRIRSGLGIQGKRAVAALSLVGLLGLGPAVAAYADELPPSVEVGTEEESETLPEVPRLPECVNDMKVEVSALAVKPGGTLRFAGKILRNPAIVNHFSAMFGSEVVNADGSIFGFEVPFDPATGAFEVDATLPPGAKPGKYKLSWSVFIDDMGIVLKETRPTVITVLNPDGSTPGGVFSDMRYAGTDRYQTSEAVALGELDCKKPVFIATGEGFADALSAAAAAAKVGGGVLLVKPAKMSDSAMELLRNKQPSDIYVVGGKSAVSDNVVTQLKTINAKVERIGGASRYETSEKIYSQFFAGSDATQAFIATGADFPDALTASAAAGSYGGPVLLVNGKTQAALSAGLVGKIKASKINQFSIIGGKSAVNEKLQASLKSLGKVDRISGADRYSTALALAEQLDKATPADRVEAVWLVSGNNFPDALSAAAYAGTSNQRLLLTHRKCLDAHVLTKVSTGYSAKGYLYLVGGESVLDESLFGPQACSK